MAAGMKHYFKNGKEYKGRTHKSSGRLMSGATHTASSRNLFHFKELSAAAKKVAKK